MSLPCPYEDCIDGWISPLPPEDGVEPAAGGPCPHCTARPWAVESWDGRWWSTLHACHDEATARGVATTAAPGHPLRVTGPLTEGLRYPVMGWHQGYHQWLPEGPALPPAEAIALLASMEAEGRAGCLGSPEPEHAPKPEPEPVRKAGLHPLRGPTRLGLSLVPPAVAVDYPAPASPPPPVAPPSSALTGRDAATVFFFGASAIGLGVALCYETTVQGVTNLALQQHQMIMVHLAVAALLSGVIFAATRPMTRG